MMRLLLWALMIVLVVVYFGTDPKHAIKGLKLESQGVERHVDDNGVVSYSTLPPVEQNSAPVEVSQSTAKTTPEATPKLAPQTTPKPRAGSAEPQ